MKIAKWKYLLSRFWAVQLFKGKDHDHNNLTLHLVNGRLRLQGEEAIYSYDDLYFVFQKSFLQAQLPHGNKLKALILGYGMGSIPFILEKKHAQLYEFTGIELDPIIVSLAQKYANPRLIANVDILPINAQKFLKDNTRKFSLICVDIFVGEEVPAFAKALPFLQQLADSLNNKNTLLLFNYMKRDLEDFEKFSARFFSVFPQGRCIDLVSNFVLVVES